MNEMRVVELAHVPRPLNGGAESSVVIAAGSRVVLVYDVHAADEPPGDAVAVVVFVGCRDHVFGGPNDEALHNHPLYKHGLRWCSACEIVGSGWIEERARIRHKDGALVAGRGGSRHFVFAMKADLLECLADEVEVMGVFERRDEAVRAGIRAVGLEG